MDKFFSLLGALSILLACDATFFNKRCTYRESCRCGLSTRRVTVSTEGCSSLFGICQIDCPKGLLSLDLGSKLRHLGLNIIPKSLCSVFKECQECDSADLRCASCPPFKYGPLCRHDCDCQNAISCQQDGKCICNVGYTGIKCQKKISCIPPKVDPPLKQKRYPVSSPSVIKYACPTNYNLIGKAEIRCINGRWNRNPPQCAKECPTPPVPDNAGVKITQSSNSKIGTIAEFYCIGGYKLTGSNKITCNSNGEWNGSPPTCVMICPKPLPPVNGGVKIISSHTPSAIKAEYYCNGKYKLVGSKTRTCNPNGEWSDSSPTCIMNCPEPLSPLHGGVRIIRSNNPQTGTIAKYYCNANYELVGNQIIICDSNGKWDDSPPVCAISCPVPLVPDNGGVKIIRETKTKTIAKYFCNERYTLIGDSILTCDVDGQWDGYPPECEKSDLDLCQGNRKSPLCLNGKK